MASFSDYFPPEVVIAAGRGIKFAVASAATAFGGTFYASASDGHITNMEWTITAVVTVIALLGGQTLRMREGITDAQRHHSYGDGLRPDQQAALKIALDKIANDEPFDYRPEERAIGG